MPIIASVDNWLDDELESVEVALHAVVDSLQLTATVALVPSPLQA